MSIKVIAFNGDLGGCFTYRLQIPFRELKAFGVQLAVHPELPNNPWGSDFVELCRLISQFDLVLIQRTYKCNVVQAIRDACDLTGKKMVFETDDDYFNLPPDNPCHPEMQREGVLDGYRKILGMADQVWVSTKELKETLWNYNRDIRVLPNNVESIMCGEQGMPVRGYGREIVDSDGKIRLRNEFGLYTVPSWWEKEGKKHRVIRIGYTGTPSHHADWQTIKHKLERIVDKYEGKVWMVFIGDPYFYNTFNAGRGRTVMLPIAPYDLYLYHLRNVDIGLAPLQPNIFNMSKSPIKAVEYGAWGVPAILPHYVTYTRDFTPGENCLTYYNSQEFGDQLEHLITSHEDRQRLGIAARDYVRDNRLERLHAKTRYEIIRELVDTTKTYKRFKTSAAQTA